MQCSYTWRRTRLHLLLHFLPTSLPCPVLQLPVSLGKYSVHLVHRSLLWLKQFLVCCFGQCGLLSFVRESLCLEIAFPLEERQAKGSSSKMQQRRAGITRKSPKCTGNTRSQARHGTARHSTATRRISFQPSFCQGLLAILQRLCATHTGTPECVCVSVCAEQAVRVLVFVCLVFGGNFALANRMENSRETEREREGERLLATE